MSLWDFSILVDNNRRNFFSVCNSLILLRHNYRRDGLSNHISDFNSSSIFWIDFNWDYIMFVPFFIIIFWENKSTISYWRDFFNNFPNLVNNNLFALLVIVNDNFSDIVKVLLIFLVVRVGILFDNNWSSLNKGLLCLICVHCNIWFVFFLNDDCFSNMFVDFFMDFFH